MKIQTRIAALFIMSLFLASCAEKDQVQKLNDSRTEDRIASVEQQVESINASVVELEKLNKALNEYVASMEKDVDSMKRVQSEDRELIVRMESAVEEVKAVNDKVLKSIDDLHTCVEVKIDSVVGWANKTFITMEYYDSLCLAVNQVKVDMAKVSAEMDSLRANMQKECSAIVAVAVEKAMVDVEAKMQKWVCDTLTKGYWNIEKTQAELNAVEKKALDSIGVVKSDLQTQIDSARVQLTRGYQAAVKQAIEDYDGVIRDVIKDSIKAVNTRIDGVVADVAGLTARVTNLEKQVSKLVARIQSIVPVPDYDDGSVKISRFSDYRYDTVSFVITPSSAVDAIVSTWTKQSNMLRIYRTDTKMVTKADGSAEFPVVGVYKNDAGELSVIYDHSDNTEMMRNFWLSLKGLSAYLVINDGNSQISSPFFSMKFIRTISFRSYREVVPAKSTVSQVEVITDPLYSAAQEIWDSFKITCSDTNVVWCRMAGMSTGSGRYYPLVEFSGKDDSGWHSGGTVTFTVSCGNASASFKVYMTPSISRSYSDKGYQPIPGAYSVGTNRKVVFQQGNVKYTNTNSGAKYMADLHLYTHYCVGNEPDNTGKTTTGKSMDLMSLSMDEMPGNYKWGVDWGTSTDGYKGAFRDWGKQYGDARMWYTMSWHDWDYLLYVRSGAEKKVGFGTIVDNQKNYYGLILLPDVFTDPKYNQSTSDKAFVPMSTTGYSANKYSAHDWELMEREGALFLPAAGIRNGTTVSKVNEEGFYWTSSYDAQDDLKNYYIHFTENSIDISQTETWNKGMSVRMVYDINLN